MGMSCPIGLFEKMAPQFFDAIKRMRNEPKPRLKEIQPT